MTAPAAPPGDPGDPGRLVGLVIPGPTHRVGVEPFFAELVDGVEEVLHPAGFAVLVLLVDDPDAELAAYRRWGADPGVAAAVVVDLLEDDPRPAVLAGLGLPFVLAAHVDSPWACTSEVADDAVRVTAALEHLVGLGHRTLGHVCGPRRLVHTGERTATVAEHARRRGLSVTTVETDYSAAAGARAVDALLARREPPTAVLFDNDVMAVAALEHLRARGVDVPGDVSLLAVDDSPLCELSVPPTTAMSLDVHHRGERLGRAVLSVLAGGDARMPAGPPSSVVVRGTTAPARQRVGA